MFLKIKALLQNGIKKDAESNTFMAVAGSHARFRGCVAGMGTLQGPRARVATANARAGIHLIMVFSNDVLTQSSENELSCDETGASYS